MELRISHSDIQTFLRCRRQWHWSYVEDYRAPEKHSGALALGTRVHAALEHYYATGEDPVVEHARLGASDIEWAELHAPSWEQDQLYEDIIIGRNCVIAHQQWLEASGADAPYEVLAVERKLEVPLAEGITLIAKVDTQFREIDTGFYWINDWKTDGGWLGSPRERLERSWQHVVYEVATEITHPYEIIGGAMYTVIKKAKRPDRVTGGMVDRIVLPSTAPSRARKKAMLIQICTEMRQIVEAMEQMGDDAFIHAYPMPSDSCRWCEFRNVCGIVDDSPAAAIDMLRDRFEHGRKHARYEEDPRK